MIISATFEMLILCFITIFISAITYYFIERPFRNGGRTRISFFVFIALGLMAITIFSCYAIKTDGAPKRLGDMQHLYAGINAMVYFKQNGKQCYRRGVDSPCKLDPKKGSKTVVVIGDSHSAVLQKSLYGMAEQKGLGFISLVTVNCSPIRGLTTEKFEKSVWLKGKTCKRNNSPEKVFAIIDELPPSIIVFSSRLPLYLNPDGLRFDNNEGGVESGAPFRLASESSYSNEDVVIKELQGIIGKGHTLVLVYPIPEVGWSVPLKLKSKLGKNSLLWRERLKNSPITTSYSVYKVRANKARQVLDNVAVGNDNLIRIYPDRVLCSEKTLRCNTHSETSLYYSDDDHLSVHGAKLVVDEVERELSRRGLLN